MRPTKAILFLFYCLAGIFAVGTAFSHLWRVRKEAVAEGRSAQALASETATSPGGASPQPAPEAFH